MTSDQAEPTGAHKGAPTDRPTDRPTLPRRHRPEEGGRTEASKLPFVPQPRQADLLPLSETNQLVKGLSLNRSQCGGCSTKYDTPAST